MNFSEVMDPEQNFVQHDFVPNNNTLSRNLHSTKQMIKYTIKNTPYIKYIHAMCWGHLFTEPCRPSRFGDYFTNMFASVFI